MPADRSSIEQSEEGLQWFFTEKKLLLAAFSLGVYSAMQKCKEEFLFQTDRIRKI